MSKNLRNLLTQVGVLWAVALAGFAMVASLALPILVASPAGGSVASGTTVNEDISVTITRAPTPTKTLPPATASQSTQVAPTTASQGTQVAVVGTTARTAAATSTPSPFAFTGAPIMAELELAILLLMVGAILGGRRFFERRRT